VRIVLTSFKRKESCNAPVIGVLAKASIVWPEGSATKTKDCGAVCAYAAHDRVRQHIAAITIDLIADKSQTKQKLTRLVQLNLAVSHITHTANRAKPRKEP
jgi:hypothetical protein